MALANGDRHFIAPKNIREMARDLTPLMDIMGDEEIVVWGWDAAIKTQLLRMGIPTEQLPTDAALRALRKCSERQSAHSFLLAFHADYSDGPYTGESIIARNLDDIVTYATQHEHIILKDPLSSSGKGLRHVNTNEEGLTSYRNRTTALLNAEKSAVDATSAPFAPTQRERTLESSEQSRGEMPSSSLNKVANWSNALIARHGYLTVEPYYDKVQDFAMEFYIRNGQCRFIGYSLFSTNHHGRYEGNLLMEDENIEALLTQHIPHSALHDVRDWVITHSDHIIPAEWDTAKHPLYFGIDMMVVCESQQSTDNRQQTEENSDFPIVNSQFKIHPCVEINLRLNMGIIAHEVHNKLLATGTEGSFHVTSFPTEEAAQLFYQEYTKRYSATYQEGKLVAGYHALTPILPHTRHHAYVLAMSCER